MAVIKNFDANNVDPAAVFDPIPNGKYVAVLGESDMVETKAGDGHYLALTFDIVEGKYRGRKVWAKLNIDNPSHDAVRIARAELSALCRAVGVMAPKDSIELHNAPISIKVVCKTRKDTGEISNVIKGYEKKEAALASPGMSPPIPQVPANAPPVVAPQTQQAPVDGSFWNK